MKKNVLIPIFSSLLMFGLGFIVANLNSCIDDPTCADNHHYYRVDCNNSTYCGIPLRDVRDMIAKYRDERASVIDQINLFPRNTYPPTSSEGGTIFEYHDSRNIVFDLDTLKNYICKIESLVKKQQSCGKLSSDYNLDGLRFYFTVYPPKLSPSDETDYMRDINEIYRNKHSLLIVPTYLKGNVQIDFDPRYTDGSLNPLAFGSIPSDSVISAFDPFGCNQAQVMNHGGMCPPRCNGGAVLMDAVDAACPKPTVLFNYDFVPSQTNHRLGIPCYPIIN